MKTSVIILATVLGLQANILFAANPDRNCSTGTATESCIAWLAPATPRVADFEEASPSEATTIDLISLKPVIPEVADFSDAGSDLNLAPEVPAVADFSDSADELPADLTVLAPVSPTEADFE
jgi:hypothetical protein